MTLEPHPHIKLIVPELELVPDGPPQHVVVVYTGLALSNLQAGYDEKALADLTGHIQAWQRENGQRIVRLRRQL